MDTIDSKILSLLKSNSRLSASEIAGEVHLSVPAVSERVRKLKDSGFIMRFTLQLDREKLGMPLVAFIFVTLAGSRHIPDFLTTIRSEEAVLECHHIAGEYDYLLKVAVGGTRELEQLVSGRLKKDDGVLRTNTVIVLSTVKEDLL